MELPVGDQISRKDFWIKHIEAAEVLEGSLKEYCELHGLKRGSMSAYRKKFGYSKSCSSQTETSDFILVTVSSLPPNESIKYLPQDFYP